MRYHNHRKLPEYLKRDYTHEEVQKLTRQEEQEETMFLGLRKTEGVLLTEELLEVYKETIQRLERKRLLLWEGGRVRLTELGIDVSNYALAEFLQDQR